MLLSFRFSISCYFKTVITDFVHVLDRAFFGWPDDNQTSNSFVVLLIEYGPWTGKLGTVTQRSKFP